MNKAAAVTTTRTIAANGKAAPVEGAEELLVMETLARQASQFGSIFSLNSIFRNLGEPLQEPLKVQPSQYSCPETKVCSVDFNSIFAFNGMVYY